MVGNECASLRQMLEVTYPMENGIVRNWEDMCHLWDYTFGPEKLDIDPKDCKLLLTEPPMNPHTNRQQMLQVMFEQYGFDSVYIAIQVRPLADRKEKCKNIFSIFYMNIGLKVVYSKSLAGDLLVLQLVPLNTAIQAGDPEFACLYNLYNQISSSKYEMRE